MRKREKPSQNHHSRFFKTGLPKLSFRFLNCEVSSVRFSSVFRKPISDIFVGFHTRLGLCPCSHCSVLFSMVEGLCPLVQLARGTVQVGTVQRDADAANNKFVSIRHRGAVK